MGLVSPISGFESAFAARRTAALMAIAILAASMSAHPSAAADSLDDAVMTAVMASRAESCAPLRTDPIAQQAAADINRSTDKWVNFEARAQPAPEALPVLADLGYGGTQGNFLNGASPDFGSAVKAVVIQGFRAIPDCSYAVAGANVLWNASKHSYFVTVVLAG